MKKLEAFNQIIGYLVCTFIFYVTMLLMMYIGYSGDRRIYIFAIFVVPVMLYFFVMGMFSFFKYYSPFTVLIYKKNIIVFSLQIINIIVFYINDAFNSDAMKKDFIIMCTLILLLISLFIYCSEYDLLKSVDLKMINRLYKNYYIEISEDERTNINECLKICRSDAIKAWIVLPIGLILVKNNIILATIFLCTVCVIIHKVYKNVFQYVFKDRANKYSIIYIVIMLIWCFFYLLVQNSVINIVYLKDIMNKIYWIYVPMCFIHYIYVHFKVLEADRRDKRNI